MRFGNSFEELCIKKIEQGIRALKLGTKTPQEAEVGKFLGKLKELNEGMADDLEAKYIKVYREYQKKNQK